MMKIAYLILSHTDAAQLQRLTNILSMSGEIFIHIDKKVKDREFGKQIHILKRNEKIHITKNSVYVTWGGYSQVEATKILLNEALHYGQFDRLVLLSGLDYPLFSPAQILDFFDRNRNVEFVGGTNLSKGQHLWQLHKIQQYHFFRDVAMPHESIFRKILIGGSKYLLKFLGIKKKEYLIVGEEKWDVYYGSQWIGITEGCAKHILQNLKYNHELIKYFKYSYAPDELVIPTIVMNSQFYKNAFLTNSCSFEELATLHYIEYCKSIKIFTEKDYHQLIHSGKMFFRKAISMQSDKLIEMINDSWEDMK